MLPDIPPAWIQAIAAFGAVLVVILILNWTGKILIGQGKLGELLINRSYDLVNTVLDKQPDPPPPEPEPPPEDPTL